jgi:hypothetical protein
MNTFLTAFTKYSLGVLMVTAPAWSAKLPTAGPTAGPPRPGSINYIDGQASIGTNSLAPGAVGSVVLEKDQILTTEAGKVEILLTPGVFLRVAENSSVKMVSSDLANIRVELQKGRALVEVIQIRRENDIRMDQNGASAKILNKGLYDFDADHAQVRVFKGKAEVYTCLGKPGKQQLALTERREVTLNTDGKTKNQGFEPQQFEDEFYRWNGLRSGYLSEASVDAARVYIGREPGWYGPGWYGLGWHWDAGLGVYTFLPVDGVYYGPFGWGFYSPMAVLYSPFLFYPGSPHLFGEFHYPYGHGFPAPGRMRP